MKKLLATFLGSIFVLSISSGVVLAAQEYSTDQQIKEISESYLTASAENMWLYSDNDLSIGTIKELMPTYDKAVERSTAFAGIQLDEANVYLDDITFAQEKAEYFKNMRSENNIQREDFSVQYMFGDPKVDGNRATIQAVEYISFYYPELPDTLSEAINYYTIELLKCSLGWFIIDISAENDTFDEMFKGTGFTAERADEFFAAQELKVADDIVAQEFQNPQQEDLEVAATTDVYYDYDAQNAADYAYTYVSGMFGLEDWGSIPSADKAVGNSFYNKNFKDFSGSGGDCQNFVSQCIWIGFNGSNAVDQIYNSTTGTYSPIMDTGGVHKWYSSPPGAGSNDFSWTEITSFNNYINGEADSNPPDMIGLIGTIAAGDDFSGVNSSMLGARLFIVGSGHTVIITDVTGTGKTLSELYFCGHTADRKAIRLDDMYSNRTIDYFIPQQMRIRTAPDLKITADLVRPISAGSTVTIGGSCNVVACSYLNMALTSPSGQITTYNGDGGSGIHRSVALNEEGLYTVTITARRTASSELVKYVYTIRTY